MPKFVFLWTDLFIWLLFAVTVFYAVQAVRNPNLRATWRRVFVAPVPMAASILLIVFVAVGLLDSLHFRPILDNEPGVKSSGPAYSTQALSPLDLILARQLASREKTYSAPLAYLSFAKEAIQVNGVMEHDFPRLKYGGSHLSNPTRDWAGDVLTRAAVGVILGGLAGLLFAIFCSAALAREKGKPIGETMQHMLMPGNPFPWRVVLWTVAIIFMLAGAIVALASGYHVFGTDQTGKDVLYQVLKSVRTALVMGALTTAAILPLALVLGIMSGFLKGWVDDVIQYFYTTISSIPPVLLIAALVLLIQVFIDKHPNMFETGIERSDIKLLFLCIIVGITEFATMCRLIRGETLKLRELDYVQAAQAFGVTNAKIMLRHIVPNVMHVVIISLVLEFSGIVLYEAVLSYVGVGVDPSTSSFGTMINLARFEMARDPAVWWNLATAFIFMLTLVLSVNLFADGIRDAFDPRARTYRPRAARHAAAK